MSKPPLTQGVLVTRDEEFHSELRFSRRFGVLRGLWLRLLAAVYAAQDWYVGFKHGLKHGAQTGCHGPIEVRDDRFYCRGCLRPVD